MTPAYMPRASMFKRATAVVLCMFLLAGCTTVKGWFGGRGKDKALEPAKLVEFTPTATVSKLWSVSAGKGEERLGLQQKPAIADGRVYAAAVEGGVRAFDLQTGQSVWRHESKARISGGPGAGEGLVVVGSLDGDVIALDAATGAEKWKAKVSNEVITAPAIGNGMVIVRSNDGRVTAFDAASGERRWFSSHELPALTVRGNGAPTLGPGYVFIGNDDGRVIALSMIDGSQLWDIPVAQAEGRSELDRISDVDGSPVLVDTTLYASSFKKQTIAIDAPSGRPLWVKDSGGVGGVGVGSDRLAVADTAGTVWGLDRATGSALWSQPILARRLLTAPAVQGNYAVVGDYDGYLHWLKLDNGEVAARTRMGGKAIKAQPVVVDGILVAQNTNGELSAYRLGQ